MTVVACRLPLLSLLPRAARHLPCVIAAGVATARFAYVVVLSIATLACDVLPL